MENEAFMQAFALRSAAHRCAYSDGATGPSGPAGEDGLSPYIGDNGNWYIGDTDTSVRAQGPTGPAGATGATGPAGPSNMTVYRANLSTTTSTPLDIVLGNAIIYRVTYSSTTDLSLSFLTAPEVAQAHCDYRIVSQYDTVGVFGPPWDAHQANDAQIMPTPTVVDTPIYNNTREMHKTWIRVQNPLNNAQWSMYDVSLFSSQNGARVIVWVLTIDEGGTY